MRLPSSRGGGGPGEKTEVAPCCGSKAELKRGPWTAEEDELLANYVKREGEGRWRSLPKKAGLLRCGKSCRLRWMNYLRPSVKRGHITPDEEDLILRLHCLLGNRWSLIAGRIPGRTDNEIKNYWNTHLSNKLISQGIDPKTHKPFNSNPTINSSPELAANTSHFSTHYAPLAPKNVIVKNEKDLGNSCEGEDAGEEMINCCADEAFSSFLNSLINDDMFNNQHHEDQQELNHRFGQNHDAPKVNDKD